MSSYKLTYNCIQSIRGAIWQTIEKRIFLLIFMYFIQLCFICRSSDFTVSEDAGIEPRQTLEGTNKMEGKEIVYIQNYTYLRLHIKNNWKITSYLVFQAIARRNYRQTTRNILSTEQNFISKIFTTREIFQERLNTTLQRQMEVFQGHLWPCRNSLPVPNHAIPQVTFDPGKSLI